MLLLAEVGLEEVVLVVEAVVAEALPFAVTMQKEIYINTLIQKRSH